MYNYTYDFNYDRVSIEIPGKDVPGLLDYVSEPRFGQTIEECDDIWDNFGFDISKDHLRIVYFFEDWLRLIEFVALGDAADLDEEEWEGMADIYDMNRRRIATFYRQWCGTIINLRDVEFGEFISGMETPELWQHALHDYGLKRLFVPLFDLLEEITGERPWFTDFKASGETWLGKELGSESEGNREGDAEEDKLLNTSKR